MADHRPVSHGMLTSQAQIFLHSLYPKATEETNIGEISSETIKSQNQNLKGNEES